MEVDEFWTYVSKKKRKYWFIYAYNRETGEIVVYVWGRRDTRTTQKLREKLQKSGITYGQIATDNWYRFIHTFSQDKHIIGIKHTGRYRRKQLLFETSDKTSIPKNLLFL